MADRISKKMTNQEISFKKQEADHHKQVQALHKQLEKLNKDVTKLKAELADKNKDARGSKAIEEAYGRLFDEKNNLECKVGALEQTKTIATQHIQELMQENKTLKAEVEGTRQHLLRTSQELQVSFENKCGSFKCTCQIYVYSYSSSNVCTIRSSLVHIHIQYLHRLIYCMYIRTHACTYTCTQALHCVLFSLLGCSSTVSSSEFSDDNFE